MSEGAAGSPGGGFFGSVNAEIRMILAVFYIAYPAPQNHPRRDRRKCFSGRLSKHLSQKSNSGESALGRVAPGARAGVPINDRRSCRHGECRRITDPARRWGQRTAERQNLAMRFRHKARATAGVADQRIGAGRDIRDNRIATHSRPTKLASSWRPNARTTTSAMSAHHRSKLSACGPPHRPDGVRTGFRRPYRRHGHHCRRRPTACAAIHRRSARWSRNRPRYRRRTHRRRRYGHPAWSASN